MPDRPLPPAPERLLPAAVTALSDAWEALFRANEAFIAVDATGSREYARVGMQVLKNRLLECLRAVDDLMEETSG